MVVVCHTDKMKEGEEKSMEIEAICYLFITQFVLCSFDLSVYGGLWELNDSVCFKFICTKK